MPVQQVECYFFWVKAVNLARYTCFYLVKTQGACYQALRAVFVHVFAHVCLPYSAITAQLTRQQPTSNTVNYHVLQKNKKSVLPGSPSLEQIVMNIEPQLWSTAWILVNAKHFALYISV